MRFTLKSLPLRTGAALLALACFAMPSAGQDQAGAWRRMTPEQRTEAWRSLPPEQREAMRDRMRQERLRRLDNGEPSSRDRFRQLSPEERVQLREQIREANREWGRGPGKGQGARK